MTVFDANAIIAVLVDEPAKPEVRRLLEAPDDPPKLSAVNLTEVLDRLVRRRGVSFDDALERVIWLAAAGLEIAEPDIEIGALAGFIRSRHYDRRERTLSLADCYAIATASVLEESLATSDRAIAAVCRQQEIQLIPLPDSTGRRP